MSDFTAEDPVYRVTYPSALERRAQARETADEPKERLTVTVGEKLPHGAGQTMPPETKEPSAAEQLEEVPSRAEPPAQEPGAPVLAEDRPARVIGEAFKAYLILESGDELLLIDKHAAHERLLYERLKAESGRTEAQYLLEPVTVTLEKNEYAALLEQLPLLAEAGFELEDFGGGTVLVRSAPLAFERADIAASVEEIAGHFAQSRRDVSTEQLDWLYHNIACRAAIKAGKPSAEEELVALVRMLREHPEVRYCPHGRPVYVALTKKELEKQFKRI